MTVFHAKRGAGSQLYCEHLEKVYHTEWRRCGHQTFHFKLWPYIQIISMDQTSKSAAMTIEGLLAILIFLCLIDFALLITL